jgi:hypothetical protein
MVRWDTGTTNPMDESFDFMLEAVLTGIGDSIKQAAPQG